MKALSLEEFDRDAAAFDGLVARSVGVDLFCSSSAWIIPAAHALMPPRRPWLFRAGDGCIAMMRGLHPEGWRYLEPLEAMWGLACPLIGPDASALAAEFVDVARRRSADWDIMLLSGLPVGSQILYQLLVRLLPHYELLQGQITTRHLACLDGGLDGFLGRRSRNFRKALRRSLRAAQDENIEFITCPAPANADAALALYRRIQRIEAHSWKGRAGVGINTGSMAAFYQDMIPRLAAQNNLRVLIARHRDRDVGYVLGGLFGTTYRGLQFSFDADYAHLSLGNLCQYHQIVELCTQGISHYDLGTGMEYKRRWAELTQDSVAVVARKR